MGTGPPKAGAGIRRVAAGLVSKKAIGKEVVQRAAGNKQDRDCAREGSLRNFYPFLRNEPPSDHDDRNNESSRLTVYPYGVASAGGVCVGAGIRTVCRAIPAGTATIASMATTSNALFCGSEELREEGLDIRGTSRNFRKFCITVPLYRKHYY